MPMLAGRNPPKHPVKKFIRTGHEYVALYKPNGSLMRLINTTTHQEVPANSQTFTRLADNNRGGKFTFVGDNSEDYHVVLAYNKKSGGYAGVRLHESYSSKADFEDWYKRVGSKEFDIVAQGVDEDYAVTLCERTPLRSHVRAAIEEATDSETGVANLELAQMRMMTVMIARRGNIMPIN